MQTLLLVLFLQSDAELERIAERVDRAAEMRTERAEQERWAAESEARRAGPAVLKHLAARFPGRKTVQLRPHCGLAMADPGFHHEVVRVMLLFEEMTIPYLTPHLRSPDVERRRMAAFALMRLPYASAVGPLIEAAGDPEISAWVRGALERAIFRRFETGDAYRSWYETRKDLTRAGWLLEALTVKDLDPYCRRHAIEAVPIILPGRKGLLPLIGALCEAEWDEARNALMGLTGMVQAPGRKAYGLTPEEREAERAAWRVFCRRPPLEQDLEIAIHCLGAENHGYYRKGGEPELLRAHPEKALELVEHQASRDLRILEWRSEAFRHIATAATYDRLVHLLRQTRHPESDADWIFRCATNPALVPKILERFGAGDAGPRGAFLESFPKLCRVEHVSAILHALPGAEGKIKRALLAGLGQTGDPRAFPVLKQQVFSDPKRACESAMILANFRGDEAIVELHRLLGSRSDPTRALAARALADKGDNSGVPMMIEMLKNPDLTYPWIVVRCLAQATGLPLCYADSDSWKVDRPRIADLAAEWWEKNKDRTRMEWLLDSLRSASSPGQDPLLIDLSDELEKLGKSCSGEEFRSRRLILVRDWIEKTGFAFDKNTGRVRYRE